MTNDEKIQRAEQLIAEANTLLNEVNEVKANSINEEDVIAKYKNDYCKGKQYYFNVNGNIDHYTPTELETFEKQSNPYSNYLTEELAEQAKELKDFNDKLLAFKYCYDRDYKPNWGNYYEDKYYVYYSNKTHKYDVDSRAIWDVYNVYFSSEEIAQKCADWLNSFKEVES